MEYHWVAWKLVEANVRRHAVVERDFLFEERIIPFKTYIVSEFDPQDLDDLRDAVHMWLAEWKKRGEKWNWDDQWQPTIFKIPNEDELCRVIKELLTETPDHKKRIYFQSHDIEVLKRHFSEEEIEKLLPDRAKPAPPPPQPPKGMRSAYVGLIQSKYTRIPLIFDLDKLGPKNMAFIGATGNGKSIAAYDVIEEALFNNIPALVLDPTGQWTGFLEPCTDPNLLSKYNEFNIAAPRAFSGKIYTPDSDVGLPLNANLLAKPLTDHEGELRAHAKELSEFLEEFCNLTAGDLEDVKNTIFDSWRHGVDLDYKSIVEATKDPKIKKKLGDLVIAKFLFEGKLGNISDLWTRGEITVISLDLTKSDENRMLASYYILRQLVNYFDSLSSTDDKEEKLRLLLVVEEANLFDDKQVMGMLDRITRTMRKKGLGTLFVTQRFVDLGNIQTNINTKGYMRTAFKADIDRAAIDIGNMADSLPALNVGTGIFFSPDYGQPIFTQFRPCMHRNTGLSEEEIKEKMRGNS